jgi:hypothetical protein
LLLLSSRIVSGINSIIFLPLGIWIAYLFLGALYRTFDVISMIYVYVIEN